MNEQIFVLVSQKRTTNHILHLLLCVPTFGFWLIVWFAVAIYNVNHNDNIQRRIDKLLQPEASGMNDVEMHRRIPLDESAASLRRARIAVVVVGVIVIVSLLNAFVFG